MTNEAETAMPPAPAGYVWVQATPSPPPWKAPLWLKALTAFWIVALVAGAVYYAKHGDATVREQTTITQAQPVVDRAVTDVVTAAGSGPVVAMSPFARIDSCSITPVRGGFKYERAVTLYVSPGAEPATLRAIAKGLPARYHAKASGTSIVSLYADAGDYVAVNGARTASGQVLVRATTGCRVLGGQLASVRPPSAPSPDIGAVLAALGAQPASLGRAQAVCGDGRVIVTDTAVATVDGGAEALPAAVAKLSATPVLSTEDVIAYRSDRSDVVVEERAGSVTISSTTRC